MATVDEEAADFRVALVLGGARSGKSALAERLACNSGLSRVYVATAEAWDGEMRERIARHRADRGEGWRTVEAPLEAADALADHDGHDIVIVLDCLTLWLSNLMLAGRDVEQAGATLCARLPAMAARVILVSNEVGLGVVPDTPLGRRFRDAQGRLNQQVAAVADRVILVAAGLPLRLK
ncbi:bifunctional adenosylcobinamide kinase/adenosylcobinamide-phosphate guanylyltransferase [Rubrimonas cliftonensis]|uniref:Bifunctional adenosylcobalamin biosynthesis protein n=1 Tax=Rubrimonas cliftonensis TaxID=89524 RepID=A0A1H4AL74_9RHOB|nr:bifunctional adenosylcobinamide kinase/adenosylcobinamide-phosphate guanylyltransferase [Rubrimonas cliftonensis]SEA36670.1 adenosylcobinamide kinase /adenosylcobinamide-phosphate guanylyltransferase [Rubrimonas cliftonensis]